VHSTFQPFAIAPTVKVPACGQLKVVNLAQADHSFLDQMQAAADKQPYSININLRNEWCIAPEVSNGSFMQSWFLAAKIHSFSGVQGSLLDNPELWRSVPNDAFFSAIRSAWAAYTTSQPVWDSQQTVAICREKRPRKIKTKKQIVRDWISGGNDVSRRACLPATSFW
jgi:hypothetical protein